MVVLVLLLLLFPQATFFVRVMCDGLVVLDVDVLFCTCVCLRVLFFVSERLQDGE